MEEEIISTRPVSDLLKCFEDESPKSPLSSASPKETIIEHELEPSPVPIGKVKNIVSLLEKGEEYVCGSNDDPSPIANGDPVKAMDSEVNHPGLGNDEENAEQNDRLQVKERELTQEATGLMRFIPKMGLGSIKRCTKFVLAGSVTKPLSTASHATAAIEPNCEDREDALSSCSINFAHPLDSDDDSYQNIDHSVEIKNEVETAAHQQSYLIAHEIMTSEAKFIAALRLLNVDFRNYIENHTSKVISENDLKKILDHLPELQALNEDLLIDLEKRINNWETNPKIADVIVKKGAFLKIYSSYLQSFNTQTQFFDDCITKYPKFANSVKEFEAQEVCKKLSLKHYMLKPVQRIPQYRLLLNNYLNSLIETSIDYEDTLTALRIVSDVADHVNKSLKHEDKVSPLIELQAQMPDFVLIKPGRELIKHAALQKVCRKSIQERYIILLNDCLVYTSQSRWYLRVHQILSLAGMKVVANTDDTDLSHLHKFTVYSKTKSFILCAKSEAERDDWVLALEAAIKDFANRRQSFMHAASRAATPQPEPQPEFRLGKNAPVWIQDNKVTMCQICTAEFTHLFRRHHCRSCGKVVCANCSDNQAPLEYKDFKSCRVCDSCFDILWKDFEEKEAQSIDNDSETALTHEDVLNSLALLKSKFLKSSIGEESKRPQRFVPDRLREVTAQDSQSTLLGWLHWKTKKSWKRQWYVLKDRVLYVYAACEDVVALNTIPVLGYSVERSKTATDYVKKELIFQLAHPKQKPIVFYAESEDIANKWFEALAKASNFDCLE